MSWIKIAVLSLALSSIGVAQTTSPSSFHSATRWRVEANLAYDALAFINTLTGDPFYLAYYRPEYTLFSARFTPQVRGALEGLAAVHRERQVILGAALALMFSARNPQTLDDVIAIAGDPAGLRRAVSAAGGDGYIPATEWPGLTPVLGAVRVVLSFLKDAGFEAYWQANIQPGLQRRVAASQAFLQRFDIIPLVESRLGFALPDDEITVYLAYFNRPHGTRILGARFVSETNVDDAHLVRTAIHEMMHPPFRPTDPALWRSLEVLKADRFMMGRFERRDPAYNYNTFEAYVEENAVRALSQIIAERLGLGVPLGTRWRASEDGGMHVLAPALYVLMRDEKFIEAREPFQAFLLRMVAEGKLGPGRVEPLYARFLELP